MSRPVVVLVHGQPGRATEWALLVRRLEPAHRVLVPDRPGWGEARSPAVGLQANADGLAQLLRARRAVPATVVGHSFGGGVALALALRHPEMVTSLVLVGSVGTSACLSALDRALGRRRLGELVSRVAVPTLVRALPLLQRSSSAPARSLAASVGALTQDDPARAWASFVTEQRALLEETPALEAALPAMTVPTVVVAGRRDRIVPPGAAEALARAIPGAALVWVPGAGHMLALQAADVLAGVVSRYAGAGPLADRAPQV